MLWSVSHCEKGSSYFFSSCQLRSMNYESSFCLWISFCNEYLSRLRVCAVSREDAWLQTAAPLSCPAAAWDTGHWCGTPQAHSLTVPKHHVDTIGVLVSNVGSSTAAPHPVLRCFPSWHCRPWGPEGCEPKQPHRTMSQIRLHSGRLFPLVEDDHSISHLVSLSRETQGWNIFPVEGEFGKVQSVKDGWENLHEKLLFCGCLLNF